MVGGAQIDAAETAVVLVVGGSVPDGVLAAHLVLQFFKDLGKRVLAIHPKNTAAGVVRHSLEIGIRHSSEVAVAVVGAGVDVVDAVDDGVGLLGRSNRLLDF